MTRNKEERTGTSFFFDEFVDENRNSKRVNSLGGDEKVVVIVNDEAEKDESRHAGNDGEKSLDLWGLPPHPCRDCVDRLSPTPHDDPFFSFSFHQVKGYIYLCIYLLLF